MPFGVVSDVDRGMSVLDGGDYRRRERAKRGIFGGEFGEFHCNQWGLCGVVVGNCVNRSICRLVW